MTYQTSIIAVAWHLDYHYNSYPLNSSHRSVTKNSCQLISTVLSIFNKLINKSFNFHLNSIENIARFLIVIMEAIYKFISRLRAIPMRYPKQNNLNEDYSMLRGAPAPESQIVTKSSHTMMIDIWETSSTRLSWWAAGGWRRRGGRSHDSARALGVVDDGSRKPLLIPRRGRTQ